MHCFPYHSAQLTNTHRYEILKPSTLYAASLKKYNRTTPEWATSSNPPKLSKSTDDVGRTAEVGKTVTFTDELEIDAETVGLGVGVGEAKVEFNEETLAELASEGDGACVGVAVMLLFDPVVFVALEDTSVGVMRGKGGVSSHTPLQ